MKKQTKPKRCCRGYEIDGVLEELQKLKLEVTQFKELVRQHSFNIYSADADVCIGMNHKMWHRIVCNYEGNICLGTPRSYWVSSWSIKEDGFHLESMLLDWKGWHGQYAKNNELKYDQLPQAVIRLHHDALVDHIKKMGIWYPCHLWDDVNDVLHRP